MVAHACFQRTCFALEKGCGVSSVAREGQGIKMRKTFGKRIITPPRLSRRQHNHGSFLWLRRGDARGNSRAKRLRVPKRMTSKEVQTVPANQDTAEGKGCFVNLRAPLIADAKTTELAEPRDGAFHDPSINAEAAAVVGTALGEDGRDLSVAKRLSVGFGVVGPISLHRIGPLARAAALSANRRNGIDQGNQLRDVGSVLLART